jgi:structural maintenance of chromosome 1
MDAVAFVLGEKTKSVRGNTLRELVHDGGKGEEHRPKRCHVTLVYLTSDGETHFTRAVTAAGTSEYRIDGAVSSYEAYDARLQTHGILLKAKNFLVFQGDVESIASKSPKELTALFELVSGSGALAADYVAAEEAKAAAESATSVAFAKRKGAMAQKKQKKEQKEEADKHLKLVEEVQELKLHRHLFSLASVESGRAALDAQLATLRSQQAAAAKRASVADAELASKKKEVAKAAKAAVLAEKEVAKASEAAAKLAPDALRNTEEASRAQKSLKTHEMTLVAAQQEAASNATKMREAETRLRKLDESVEAEQRQLALAAARGAEVVLTDALREEWKTVSEEAASRTSGMKADLTAAQSRHSGAPSSLCARSTAGWPLSPPPSRRRARGRSSCRRSARARQRCAPQLCVRRRRWWRSLDDCAPAASGWTARLRRRTWR